MNSAKLVKGLKGLLDNPVDPTLFPVQKGSRINIGSYSIKPIKSGWSVMSYKSNEIIANTYTKAAALAIAKNLNKNRKVTNKILELDKLVAKHHMDCMFYEYTMKVTKNMVKYESTVNRYDISKHIELESRDKLKSFIL